MFWPFTRWTFRPAPWGPSRYNMPVELSQASFMAARAHNWPKYADRFASGFQTPMPEYMVSPTRPVGAYSKHPREAFQAIHDSSAAIRQLADQALLKNAAGVGLNVAEAQALMVVHLPPVRQQRERCGAGMTPDWDVPFCPRDTAPPETRAVVAGWVETAAEQRKRAVGYEIAQIESIRAQWLALAKSAGRGR